MHRSTQLFGWLCIGCAVFVLGYLTGMAQTHAGKVLVPEDKGTPSDLPYWACSELVELRIDSMNWRQAVLRSAVTREPVPRGVIEHFATAGKECE